MKTPTPKSGSSPHCRKIRHLNPPHWAKPISEETEIIWHRRVSWPWAREIHAGLQPLDEQVYRGKSFFIAHSINSKNEEVRGWYLKSYDMTCGHYALDAEEIMAPCEAAWLSTISIGKPSQCAEPRLRILRYGELETPS